MLVAIGIIVILSALTLGVIASVIAAQTSKTAEQGLDKVASLLEQQWKAVIDQSRDEYRQKQVHPNLMAAANNNADTAQTVWTQLRLRQEFPASFAEATHPVVSGPVSLQPKQYYVRALAGLPATTNPSTWQSSVCLVLALSQSRRGVQGRLEEAVGESTIQYVNGVQVLVDPWGTPIGFRRVNNDLDAEVYSAGPNRIPGDNDDLSSLRLRQAGARGD
jgi:hypothetical protein